MAQTKAKSRWRGPEGSLSKDTRFRPGVSGNPGGRPRTKVFTEILREEVAAIDPKTGEPQARLLARALIAKGKRGFVGALTEIADRLEGKVALPVQVEHISEETVKIIAELATTYNLLGPTEPARRVIDAGHPFGCTCVICSAPKQLQSEQEALQRVSQTKMLSGAEMAKLTQQYRDLEDAKLKDHTGPAFPSL